MTNIENAQIKELSSKIEAQNVRLEAQNIRLEQTNLHVTEMKTVLDSIDTALRGSSITEDGGMVKRLQLLEIDVKAFNIIKSKWLGIVWLIVVAGGTLGILYYGTSIWKILFK